VMVIDWAAVMGPVAGEMTGVATWVQACGATETENIKNAEEKSELRQILRCMDLLRCCAQEADAPNSVIGDTERIHPWLPIHA
jgi:hypothetical protein